MFKRMWTYKSRVLVEKKKFFWGISNGNGIILLLRKCKKSDEGAFSTLVHLKYNHFFACITNEDSGFIVDQEDFMLKENISLIKQKKYFEGKTVYLNTF